MQHGQTTEAAEPGYTADTYATRAAHADEAPDRASASKSETSDASIHGSFFELSAVLLKRRKLMIRLPLAAAILTAAISLILPKFYTASTTFVPENARDDLGLPGGLAGLASQFGVSASSNANSPQFYSQLIRSRSIMEQILAARFSDPRSAVANDSAELLDILGIPNAPRAERLEEGVDEIHRLITTSTDWETNLLTLGVRTHHAQLSADVANQFVVLLNKFNLSTRQSNARERRRFVEARLAQAEAELRASEDSLRQFLEENRQFRDSPQLEFQHGRLERQVTIRQEVFTTLRRQYEEARIQEVNDTPVITVIDAAVVPQVRSSPRRKRLVMAAFGFALVLATLMAFTAEFFERARRNEPQRYREFADQWRHLRTDWAFFGRRSK